MFELTRQTGVPLVDQIVERMSSLIRRDQLPGGSRLPSIRKLASLLDVSPYTVADAYDRLVARGSIESRAGRGFFVARPLSAAGLVAVEANAESTSEALALASATMGGLGKLIPAGSGFLPAHWLSDLLPGSVLGRLSQQRRPEAWLTCPVHGLAELREQLSGMLVRRGVAAGPANLLTTFGASQAFDLICRELLSPGDTVLVEDPGYFVLFEQLRAHGLRLVAVPRLVDGPDLAALEAMCRAHRPRAFFLQTLLHNPTGTSTSAATAHRLLSLAEQYGFMLIEDDVYGDLYEGNAVRLAQIDGFRHVIHVGSFTKLLGPSIRVGFVAADARVVNQLAERKMLAVLTGSSLLEALVSDVLEAGRYRRHLEQVRQRLVRVRREARRTLAGAGLTFDTESGEGIFLWARLPAGTDVDALARDARAHSILLAKGNLFSPSGAHRDRLRFNAVHSTAPELASFLRGSLAFAGLAG